MKPIISCTDHFKLELEFKPKLLFHVNESVRLNALSAANAEIGRGSGGHEIYAYSGQL